MQRSMVSRLVGLVAAVGLLGSLASGWAGLPVAAARGTLPVAVGHGSSTSAPPTDCVSPPGLVAWWRAEGDALDGVGGYHGTLQAGAGFAPGRVGQAFSFDGRGAHVAVPAGNAFVHTGAISVEAWINPAGKVGSYDPIVKQAGSGGSGQDDGFALEFAGGNDVKFWVYVDGSGWHGTSAVSVPMNQWSHLVATYDGATSGLYLNGVLAGSGSTRGPVAPSANALNIGRDPANPDRLFRGLIDEVSIYDRGLSAAEVRDLYVADASGKCGPGPVSTGCANPPPGIVAWWPAEGNAADMVGGHDATLAAGAGIAPGKVGQAFSFDGRGGHVAAPAGSTFGRGGVITVEAWINPAGKVGAYDPVVKQAGTGSSQDNGFSLEFAGGNDLKFWVFARGAGWRGSSAVAVPTNQWSHVVGTYDGATVALYLNGQLAGSAAAPGGIVPSSNPLNIGRDPANPDRLFRGLIDEVSIYDRGLTPAEVQAIFAAGAAGKCR